MDFVSVLRAAGRRWYVLIVGVLATAGLAYGAFQVIPITFDARASFLLVPPPITEEQPDENPFLHLGGLDIVAGVLAKSLSDTTTAETIIPPGSKDEYVVHPDDSVAGSVLEVITTASSERQAFRMLDEILATAETRLAQLQSSVNASPKSQITMMVITDNTTAVPNTSTVIRTMITVAAAGLALTAILAIAVDSLVRRWKSRPGRRRRSASEKPVAERPAAVDVPDADRRLVGPRGAGEVVLVPRTSEEIGAAESAERESVHAKA